jgi:hypothetical protein
MWWRSSIGVSSKLTGGALGRRRSGSWVLNKNGLSERPYLTASRTDPVMQNFLVDGLLKHIAIRISSENDP